MVRNTIPEVVPKNVVDVYWCLRVLANAWAKAGNYEVDSKSFPGTKVIMMPLATGLDYADRALRVVLGSGVPSVDAMSWLERRDRITRTAMANLIQQKWPAGEALTKAIEKTAGDWTVIHNACVVGPHDGLAFVEDEVAMSEEQVNDMIDMRKGRSDKKRKKGAGKGKDGGKKGFADRNNKRNSGITKIGRVASTMPKAKGGQKICGAFNAKKGCTKNEKACPFHGKHVCAYILDESGRPCGRYDCDWNSHSKWN